MVSKTTSELKIGGCLSRRGGAKGKFYKTGMINSAKTEGNPYLNVRGGWESDFKEIRRGETGHIQANRVEDSKIETSRQWEVANNPSDFGGQKSAAFSKGGGPMEGGR